MEQVDKVDIHHVFIGDANSKNLIIFLHEGLGSVAQWKNFPEKVCAEAGAYGLIYDRAGYGKSSGDLTNRQVNYLHLAADELDEIITHIAPKGYDIILYGHSDGGSIALIYAANHPGKIKAVITEAAHVFVEDVTIKGVKEARPYFKAGKFEGLKKYHGERYEEVFFAWNDIWLNPEFRDWNITELLPNIKVPQLIIQGIDDQYGTLEQVLSIEKQTSGNSTVFTPENCGHAPHKEKQNETLIRVGEFIHSIDN